MSTCGILFVKNPRPGRVKTRLHTCCAPEEATALYRAFVLDSTATLKNSAAELKVIACDPPEEQPEIQELIDDASFTFVPQPRAGLGERLDQLLRWSFAQGVARAFAIGSDSPSLPASYLDQALESLRHCEVVIGPSTDRGYYLIGLNRPIDGLFAGIEWSTGRVLQQTLERLGGCSLGLLPPWYDVDTPQDAGLLRVHLEALHRAGHSQGAHSLRALRALELSLPS